MLNEHPVLGVETWYHAWASRDFAALAAMYHPDAEFIRPDGRSAGVERIVAYWRTLAAADPGATATVEAAHFASDVVTVEWTERQSQGPGDTAPPANQVVDVFRVLNGRIVSHHQYLDPARRLRLLAEFASRTAETTDPSASTLDPGTTMVPAAAVEDPAGTVVPDQMPHGAAEVMKAVRPDPVATGDLPELRVEAGPDDGLCFAMNGDVVNIGRVPDNEVVLRDAATSGHHARVERRDGQFYAVDLDSTNGTYVNGEKIRLHRLSHGDRLTIGLNVLVLVEPSPSPVTSTSPPAPAS